MLIISTLPNISIVALQELSIDNNTNNYNQKFLEVKDLPEKWDWRDVF